MTQTEAPGIPGLRGRLSPAADGDAVHRGEERKPQRASQGKPAPGGGPPGRHSTEDRRHGKRQDAPRRCPRGDVAPVGQRRHTQRRESHEIIALARRSLRQIAAGPATSRRTVGRGSGYPGGVPARTRRCGPPLRRAVRQRRTKRGCWRRRSGWERRCRLTPASWKPCCATTFGRSSTKCLRPSVPDRPM